MIKVTVSALLRLMVLPCMADMPANDRVIMRAVLSDFATRNDTLPYHANGIILIARMTEAWSNERVGVSELAFFV